MQKVILAIPGLSCGNFVRHVREALSTVPGIGSHTVDLERKQLHLEVDGMAALAAAQAKLAEDGYPATVSSGG